jgi:hypothetical protein
MIVPTTNHKTITETDKAALSLMTRKYFFELFHPARIVLDELLPAAAFLRRE